MNLKKFIKTIKCPLDGYLTGKFKNESNKNLELAMEARKLFTENSLTELTNINFVIEILTNNLSPAYFTLEHERKLNIETIADGIVAVSEFLKGFEIISKEVDLNCTIDDIVIRTKVFMIAKKDNSYYFFKLSKGKCKFAKKAEGKTSITAEPEFLVLYQMAEKYLKDNNLSSNDVYIGQLCLTANKKKPTKALPIEETINEFGRDRWILSEDTRIEDYSSFDMNRDYWINIHNEIEKGVEISKSLNILPTPCDNCQYCTYKQLCNYITNGSNTQKQLETANTDISNSGNRAVLTLNLTENQKKLTEFTKGIGRVLASAGSGKTTTLAGVRTANLISYYGYDEKDFLFLTFSERGVKEISEKLKFWLKEYDIKINVNKFRIYTFNGFGDKILSENYIDLGYNEAPRLMLKSERKDLIAYILNKHNMIEGLNYSNPTLEMFRAKGVIPYMESLIQWYGKHINEDSETMIKDFLKNEGKNSLLEDEEFISKFAKETYQIYEEFCDLKKKKNLIEYDDQIKEALNGLKNQNLAIRYSTPHLVVDEFQDSDELQLDIIRLLIQTPRFESFIACGDDSQSIFSWRGATQDNIIEFEKYFGDLGNITDIELTDNFRCNSAITEFSNRLNDLNSKKYDKQVKSYKQSQKEDSIKIDFDVIDMQYEILDNIKELNKLGYKYEDIAVIARTNSELVKISDTLNKANIPNNLIFSQKMIEIPEVRALLAFGKYLRYPDNDLYFTEFYQILIDESLLEIQFDDLLNKEQELKTLLDSLSDDEILKYYYDVVKAKASINNGTYAFNQLLIDEDFKDIYELTSWLNSFIDYEEDISIEKDLTRYKAISLMTAHSSKGSEYKAVIIPVDKFKSDSDEERRSLFVAITRAKEKIVLLLTRSKNSLKIENELIECYNNS